MPECASMEDGGACASSQRLVQLEPFVHQVGGHSCMLRYDDRSVCKPLINREHHFYQIMPDTMRNFTPQYRGVIEVSFQEDSAGYITLAAHPPSGSSVKKNKKITVAASNSPSSGGDTAQSDSDSEGAHPLQDKTHSRFRLCRSGSIEMEHNPPDSSHNRYHHQAESPPPLARASDPNPGPHHQNMWCLRLHKKQLSKMKKSGRGAGPHKFILLENLVSQLHCPSILDLKMGTRQHGDDATDEKRKSQMRKCESTTSCSLGVRICGMKVYQTTTGGYVCLDKYYGRRLDRAGVMSTLYQFLHNGLRLRVELIEVIVARLRRLYQTLSQLTSYRFYSSSLLVLLDGGDASGPKCESGEDGTDHYDDDWSPVTNLNQQVDVRMIDFAHVTHQGFRGDRTVHSGPDSGYLFGLDNIMRMFLELKAQYGDDNAVAS